MPDLPINLRPMQADDKGLVVVSWASSYRLFVPWLRRDDYEKLYRSAICRTLDHTQVIVACSPDLNAQVFGWICGEPYRGLLHYLFVKSDYRQLGLGTRLLAELAAEAKKKLIYTHWTRDLAYLQRSKLLDGYRPDQFNPKEIRNYARERGSVEVYVHAGGAGRQQDDHEQPREGEKAGVDGRRAVAGSG